MAFSFALVWHAAQQPTAGPLVRKEYRPPPPRPGYGTRGQPIQLKVNLFPVRFPRGELYHYDITIAPKCPKRINRVVFEALMEKYARDIIGRQKPVFDGSKNMYCRQQLPIPADKPVGCINVVMIFLSDIGITHYLSLA